MCDDDVLLLVIESSLVVALHVVLFFDRNVSLSGKEFTGGWENKLDYINILRNLGSSMFFVELSTIV